MTLSFTLGIEQLQDELIQMQSPGCYWITADRQPDARFLARQVIAAQQALTLISSAEKPQELLTPAPGGFTARVAMYSLPATRKALIKLDEDLLRALSPRPGLILLYTAYASWQTLTAVEISSWLKKINALLATKQSSLLIITSGTGVNTLRGQLQSVFRYLDGASHLEWQQDSWHYRINWWSNGDRLLADRAVRLNNINDHFILATDKAQSTPLTLNDEKNYIAEKQVLEGAPPISHQWLIFDNNEAVYSRAQQASSATIIFNLNNNQQINSLAESIHSLRRTRGSALKIVVREMQTSLRYSDERLLLACGVNTIVPFGANLSHFLTTLEAIQGQSYNRHVPADLKQLQASMQPLHEKGYLPLERFCDAVTLLINNTQLPENGKGLLVALRPVPELQAQQALTLCKTRRYGDLVTLIDDRLYLFLSSCRFNDLDIALKNIFRLPHDEIFTNRMIWYQDLQILSEVRQIKGLIPTAWRDLPPEPEAEIGGEKNQKIALSRRVPEPITLGRGTREVNRQ